MSDAIMRSTRAEYLPCGTYDTAKRAAAWAAERGLKQSTSHYRCAHGLLRKRPRDYTCGCHRVDGYRLFDHTTLWLRDGIPAVLLTQPYLTVEMAEPAATAYADKWGLVVTIGDPADAWYGFGTLPIRFEVAR